ncbi:MAG TPA: hypothetical protein EYO58_00665, partial [Flavobacteriales bacterium]|nr:hypothetical protein [Flavobacteriales bacterium]
MNPHISIPVVSQDAFKFFFYGSEMGPKDDAMPEQTKNLLDFLRGFSSDDAFSTFENFQYKQSEQTPTTNPHVLLLRILFAVEQTKPYPHIRSILAQLSSIRNKTSGMNDVNAVLVRYAQQVCSLLHEKHSVTHAIQMFNTICSSTQQLHNYGVDYSTVKALLREQTILLKALFYYTNHQKCAEQAQIIQTIVEHNSASTMLSCEYEIRVLINVQQLDSILRPQYEFCPGARPPPPPRVPKRLPPFHRCWWKQIKHTLDTWKQSSVCTRKVHKVVRTFDSQINKLKKCASRILWHPHMEHPLVQKCVDTHLNGWCDIFRTIVDVVPPCVMPP